MSNDLVSIIVPIYNVEPYLEQCLISVKNQSYTNLEIMMVDDGSTDNSGKIADIFAKNDSRFKVIHKDNAGSSSARNVALDKCSGQFIAFIDSDDFVDGHYISSL